MRHGWPLALPGAPVLLPVETAPDGIAAAPRLLISAARAATLKLANQRDAADPHHPVLIRDVAPVDLVTARAIADPVLDLANPLKGPFASEPLPCGAGLPRQFNRRGAGQRRILQRPAIVSVIEVDVARGHRAKRA